MTPSSGGSKIHAVFERGKSTMRWLIALTMLAVSAPAFAQDDGGKVAYEKKTVINFEDDTIQGDLTRPDGEYVDARRKVQHSNLIKIREDFRDEVLRSAKDL